MHDSLGKARPSHRELFRSFTEKVNGNFHLYIPTFVSLSTTQGPFRRMTLTGGAGGAPVAPHAQETAVPSE